MRKFRFRTYLAIQKMDLLSLMESSILVMAPSMRNSFKLISTANTAKLSSKEMESTKIQAIVTRGYEKHRQIQRTDKFYKIVAKPASTEW